MFVLFETAAGFALFKLLDEKKLEQVDDLYREFETPEKAGKIVKLKHFSKFKDMTDALSAATAAVEGKMGKGLKKLLKKVFSSDIQEQLAVADAKLGSVIKEKLNIGCVHNSAIDELFRGIRYQMCNLITNLPQSEVDTMALGLSHSLSRYKLKFSPDKVDVMIIQAIALLDDLDKELNNYNMRCREWYGWHFPELGRMVTDNLTYARVVKTLGMRANIGSADLASVLEEDVEEEVRAAAEVSMGTEISDHDMDNISHLCDQVIEISDYRGQLYEYLKNRMLAIAPNLTVMVGELVGARLIAHAGSLMNLAKHPSSTVQILGAEKALFRALKTKHDTPKYGLIYHASLVGQTAPKNKGRISRMLAAKASLCVRVDALGEDSKSDIGLSSRIKVEERMQQYEEGDKVHRVSGTGKARAKAEKYEMTRPTEYNVAGDFTFTPASGKKRKREGLEQSPEKRVGLEQSQEKRKRKREVLEQSGEILDDESGGNTEESGIIEKSPEKKKTKKEKLEAAGIAAAEKSPEKKKTKKEKLEVAGIAAAEKSPKKKKIKKEKLEVEAEKPKKKKRKSKLSEPE